MQKRQKTRDPVLVLSQNEILCEGLKSIVVKMPRLQLAGATTQVDNLEDLARLLNPKVILLALADGCDKELAAVQALTSEFSDLAVLVLANRPSPGRGTGLFPHGNEPERVARLPGPRLFRAIQRRCSVGRQVPRAGGTPFTRSRR